MYIINIIEEIAKISETINKFNRIKEIIRKYNENINPVVPGQGRRIFINEQDREEFENIINEK